MKVTSIKTDIESYCCEELGYEMCIFDEYSRPKNKEKRFMVYVQFITPDTYGEGIKSDSFCSRWAKTKTQAYENLYEKIFEGK